MSKSLNKMSGKTSVECFAYWSETPMGSYRWGTLLVSGGDDRIIGNAVLKNPGSAEPLPDNLFSRSDGRLSFTLDATMYAIVELFHLDIITGTVRLFNLMDFRDAHPEAALRTPDNCIEDVLGQIEAVPDIPTYLGWGELWKQPPLNRRAMDIFNLVHSRGRCSYLRPSISDNEFFHPLYLLRYGKNEPSCKDVVERFQRDLMIQFEKI